MLICFKLSFRLAVALELTSIEMGPNLICLDECTSGLDSNSSRIVSMFSCVQSSITVHFLLSVFRSFPHCTNWHSLTH